jgi:hypothetical protein
MCPSNPPWMVPEIVFAIVIGQMRGGYRCVERTPKITRLLLAFPKVSLNQGLKIRIRCHSHGSSLLMTGDSTLALRLSDNSRIRMREDTLLEGLSDSGQSEVPHRGEQRKDALGTRVGQFRGRAAVSGSTYPYCMPRFTRLLLLSAVAFLPRATRSPRAPRGSSA